MPKYAYQVRTGAGKIDAGVLTAADAMEASRILRKEGGVVVGLREDNAVPAVAAVTGNKKVGQDDVIYFATQMSVMVDTGVPLAEALDAISEQSDHSGMKKMIGDISGQVKGGVEFSKALEQYPKCFSQLFISLMKASEASGTMGSMLGRICDYMVDERETRKRIKGAMIYPASMMVFCVLVVTALLVFVLPKFAKIYEAKGAALPLPTHILMSLSQGIIDHWQFVLGSLGAAAVGSWLFLRTPGGKIAMDAVKIRIPLLGPMCRKSCIARSLRTMATMVSTGVNMLEGLQITAEVAGNHFYKKIWKDVAEKIKEGSSVSEELYGCKLIPRTITQMIAAGERTGKLEKVMNRVAEFCEADLKVAIKSLTSMIEPIMIIVMGLIVGGIAMALLLPIFSIAKVVAH